MIFRLLVQGLWLCQSLSLRHLSFQRRGLAAVGPGVKRFQLDEKDLSESFARGSGPGGQKINKSKNCVHLVHIPTGISVDCQDARDLTTNRKLARKWLADKVDLALHGDNSKLGKKFEKIRKRKRSAARYGHNVVLRSKRYNITSFLC
jgi:protein subunit release factor B